MNSKKVRLLTTHIPPGSSNKWIKIETLEGIFEFIKENNQLPIILCGDFNTPQYEREDGTVITWGQNVKKDGKIVLRKSRGSRWDEGERNILTGLEQFGLFDMYRYFYGYESKDYSWYWNGKVELEEEGLIIVLHPPR